MTRQGLECSWIPSEDHRKPHLCLVLGFRGLVLSRARDPELARCGASGSSSLCCFPLRQNLYIKSTLFSISTWQCKKGWSHKHPNYLLCGCGCCIKKNDFSLENSMFCTSEFSPDSWTMVSQAASDWIGKGTLSTKGSLALRSPRRGLEELSMQESQHSDLKVVDLILFVWGQDWCSLKDG